VFVYLERTLATTAPRPYGVAPAALHEGAVIAAVGPGEAVWLGFQAVDPARPATVHVLAGATEIARLVCPPDSRLDALDASELTLRCSAPEVVEVAVRLVDPAEFTRLTGRAHEPVDTERGYKGWRLP
jgi:hypothetical protein